MVRRESEYSGTLQDVLSGLVKKELNTSWRHSTPLDIVHSRKTLYPAYRHSPLFAQRYRLATNYLLKLRSDAEVEKLKRELVGKMFEDMAYMVTATRCLESETVLSPESTLAFVRHIYPTQPVVEYIFGRSLAHRYVPDGFGVAQTPEGNWAITTLYEYTVYPHHRFDQVSQELIWYKSDVPQLFDHAATRFVVPEGSFPGVKDVETVPFTADNFGDFVNGVYNYSPFDSDDAPLTYLQEWVREQSAQADKLDGVDVIWIETFPV